MPARRPGGTSRRGLGLFRASPAVLLPCGSVDWDGDGAEGASATGSEEEEAPPAAPSAARGRVGDACAACPPLSWWPWVGAVVVPAEGTAAAVERGCSGPLRCG